MPNFVSAENRRDLTSIRYFGGETNFNNYTPTVRIAIGKLISRDNTGTDSGRRLVLEHDEVIRFLQLEGVGCKLLVPLPGSRTDPNQTGGPELLVRKPPRKFACKI